MPLKRTLHLCFQHKTVLVSFPLPDCSAFEGKRSEKSAVVRLRSYNFVGGCALLLVKLLGEKEAEAAEGFAEADRDELLPAEGVTLSPRMLAGDKEDRLFFSGGWVGPTLFLVVFIVGTLGCVGPTKQTRVIYSLYVHFIFIVLGHFLTTLSVALKS